jgi:hypothetical protein
MDGVSMSRLAPTPVEMKKRRYRHKRSKLFQDWHEVGGVMKPDGGREPRRPNNDRSESIDRGAQASQQPV